MKKGIVIGVVFLFSVLGLSAQYQLRGVVVDENHEPMIGVSVRISNSSVGTVTDLEGRFVIDVSDKKPYDIMLSYMGYVEHEQRVIPDKDVKIFMQPDVVALNEFVVVGYNTVKKSHLTGAVASIKGDDVMRSTTTDAAAALQGKIAGVVVERTSGKPGAGVSIKVRGVGTLGNAEPLYVIDGIYSSSLTLAPEDIESIEVLKDASAAAIYGSQAANGVVLVTSKKGVKGMPKVEYSGSVGVQLAEGMPDMANGKEYAQYWYTAHVNDGKGDIYENGGSSHLHPDSAGVGTDWYGEVYKPALYYRQNVRVSGGGEHLNAALSLNHTNQDGTYINTGFRSYGGKFDINFNRKKWHFGSTVNLSQSEHSGLYDASQLSTLIYSPLAIRANDDGTFDDGTYDYQRGFDPVFYAKNFKKDWTNRSLSSMVWGSFDIIKGLAVRVNFSYNYGTSLFVEHNKELDIPGRANPSVASRIESHSTSYGMRPEVMLTYNSTIKEKHTINSVVGITRGYHKWSNLWIRADDLVDDSLPVLSGSEQIVPSLSEGGDLGYFAQANYAYDNRYLVGASVRVDGSSKFHKDYRYGIFPAASVGWNIHNEPFFKSSTIDELKLRGSFGQLGNSAIGDYTYESSVNVIHQALNYVLGKDQDWLGSAQMSYASPGVHWETSTTWNVGADLAMLKNKLTVTAEVYQRTTTDALIAVPLPGYSGSLNSPAQNVGSLRNQGVELSLMYRNYDKKFKYSVAGNISFVSDKVLSMGNESAPPIYGGYVGNQKNGVNLTQVGRSIAEFYLIKTDGLFCTQEDLDAHVFVDPKTGASGPIQPKAQLGDVRYVDFNNDGVITDADKQFCGKSAPLFYYSTTAHFEYCGFDLDLFFNGEQSKKIFNYAAREALVPQGVWQNVSSDLLTDAWNPDNIDAKYPRIGLTDPNGNGDIFTDRWLENGSFFRLQNLQLGYSIPVGLLKKAGMDKVRVYFNTTNVFTLTKYSMGNPEVGNESYVQEAYAVLRRGVNSWQYPMFRTFSFGLQIGF